MKNKIENPKSPLEQSLKEKQPYKIKLCDAEFYVHPQVFSPKYFRCSELMNSQFPFLDNETFLEIGCGIGVTSVLAALHHNNKVVCGDINPFAVDCVRKNAEMNNISHLIDVRETDVFSGIQKNEKFDTIYWDLPFVFIADDYEHKNLLERAIYDPGYQNIKRFLKEAPNYLKKAGRILVGFGNNGDYNTFHSIASNYGYHIEEILKDYLPERCGLTYMIFKLII
ncbi:MAG: methyltransferase [bacterium]|nr:methyltransferase [bacterium]